MNAQQITAAITEKVNFTSLYSAKPGQHVDVLLRLGRCWPANKAQAKKVNHIDVLYNTDVDQLIEPMLNKHGFKGEYKVTKSGRNCRLVNEGDLFTAFKMEFGF